MSKLKNISIITIVVVLSTIIVQVSAGKPASPLLKGAYRVDQNGWIYVHLEGKPFEIGYQNGYLLADNIDQSWKACIHVYWTEEEFGDWWYAARDISRLYIWPKLTAEMKVEIEGITAGVRAKGLSWDKWDILAFNSWADIDAYWDLWEEGKGHPTKGHTPLQHWEKGCSAFIATGSSWTESGEIVIGHNTWAGYAGDGYWNVIFDVEPEKGNRMVYQSTGGCIWSGQDWIYNDAGLMVCETTLPSMYTYNVEGIPVFVRIRYAMQYGNTIDDFIDIMTYKNSGAYANEWLIGDAKTGEICSLQLGCYVWDIERTNDGMITSCNYPKGPNVRSETYYDWTIPETSGYSRDARWEELKAYYEDSGLIDCDVGMNLLSDHEDTWTGTSDPSSRTLCGHCEDDPADDYYPEGAYDGKVTCSSLVLNDMGMWGRWGHPCGTPFDAEDFLISHPEYEWQLPYLQDLPIGGTKPWTYFTEDWTG
jgi:hypothetical protein